MGAGSYVLSALCVAGIGETVFCGLSLLKRRVSLWHLSGFSVTLAARHQRWGATRSARAGAGQCIPR